MKTLFALCACICVCSATNVDAQPAKAGIDDYEPGPDSKPQPGVPQGKSFSFQFEDSQVFPGTSRNITVYVPAQYKGDKPACVYVGLDSLGFGVPVVFDNLIHKGEMPITIAIVFFHDTDARRFRKISIDGEVSDASSLSSFAPRKNALSQSERRLSFAFSKSGDVVTVDGINATCLTVTSNGSVYATEAEAGKVWLVKPDGSRTLMDEGLKHPTGIALSPDGLWLAVMESHTHWGYSYRVKLDGTVELKQRFFWAHVADWTDDSGAGSMCMDRDGHPYVATHRGVQIFDRNGRSRGILRMPAGQATSVCFGGEKFNTLFATSGGKLYRRHMKAVGAPSFIEPIKLPPWGGG